MYIQDKVEQYSDEVFERLDGGAHIYFCGLKASLCVRTTYTSRYSCVYVSYTSWRRLYDIFDTFSSLDFFTKVPGWGGSKQ